MENQNNGGSSGLDELQSFLSDYYKADDQSSNSGGKRENLLAKYFVPRNTTEEFRLLPLKGHQLVEFAFFHRVKVNDPSKPGGKGNKKVYCPAHNDPKVPKLDSSGQPILDQAGNPVLVPARCPLCEKQKAILAKQDQSIRYKKKEDMSAAELEINEKNKAIYKASKDWEARKYYIARGIDKGSPKDGIKFWRFIDNYKKQGDYDKLIPAIKSFYDQHQANPADVEKGCDFVLNVIDSSLPNGAKYKYVNSIFPKAPSRLHEDSLVVKELLNDPISWRDVFKKSTITKVISYEEYLERIARGTDPYWDATDSNNKRYVFPDPSDAELQAAANQKSESLQGEREEKIELASDIVNASYSPNISDVTKEDIGTFKDDSVDLGAQFTEKVEEESVPEQAPVSETVTEQAPQQEVSAPAEPVAETQQTETHMDMDDLDDLPF
jgi:hypothetical protein